MDLCRLFGYTAEEHVLQTKDGYLLCVHRLAWRKGEEDQKVNAGTNSIKKRVIYMHHGLLMNSEVWVCLTDAQRCLPFVLVDRGFDVWVGIPGRAMRIRLGASGANGGLVREQSRQQVLQEICPMLL